MKCKCGGELDASITAEVTTRGDAVIAIPKARITCRKCGEANHPFVPQSTVELNELVTYALRMTAIAQSAAVGQSDSTASAATAEPSLTAYGSSSDAVQLALDGFEAVTAPDHGAAVREPAPVGNGEEVWPVVMQDLRDRVVMGRTKYGTTLRTHNGRNALWDAYQEALDLVLYLRQSLMEREPKRANPNWRSW